MNVLLKKIAVVTIGLSLCIVSSASANDGDVKVTINPTEAAQECSLDNLEVVDGIVPISFEMNFPRKTVDPNKAYVVKPVLKCGTWERPLPDFIVMGKKYSIVKAGHFRFKETKNIDNTIYDSSYVVDGEDLTVDYQTSVPFSNELRGAQLIVTTTEVDKCQDCKADCDKPKQSYTVENGVIDFSNFYTFDQTMYLKPTYKQCTIKEQFGNKSVFQLQSVELLRENFDQPFEDLCKKLEALKKEGVRFDSVFFNVATSPDGPLALNKRLTAGRVETTKDVVEEKLEFIPADVIEYKGIVENWDVFIELLQKSNLYTEEIENIIATVEDYDEREKMFAKSSVAKEIVEIYKTLRNCTADIYYTQQQDLGGKIVCFNMHQLQYGVSEYNMEQIKLDYKKEKTPTTINNMMVAYAMNSEFEKAFEIARTISNKDICPVVANNKAVVLTYVKDYPIAEHLFKKSCKVKGAKANLAMLYLKTGENEKAIEIYGKCNSTNSIAANLSAGRYADAAALTFERDPKDAEALYLRSLAYSYTEKTPLVLSTLGQACQYAPKYKKQAQCQAEFIPLRGEEQFKAIVKQ